MKFGFVAKHRGIWPVDVQCGALGVSRSGFYAWCDRPQSARSRSDAVILQTIRVCFAATDSTYGARRMITDVRAAGHTCGRQRVARLMRCAALHARPRRRAKPTDTGYRALHMIAPNVLDREFTAPAPNQKWVADFTYLWTHEGWLFVAAVLDLFSRRIVGWAMQSSMTSQLVTDALLMAVWRRGPSASVLHHSDQGRPIHERGVSAATRQSGRHVQHEPLRQRLGQRGDGKFLLDNEDRTMPPQRLSNSRCGTRRRVRLYRTLLQYHAEALIPG